MTTRVAIVGATGYAGSELTAILAKHPEVELVGLIPEGAATAAAANGLVFDDSRILERRLASELG